MEADNKADIDDETMHHDEICIIYETVKLSSSQLLPWCTPRVQAVSHPRNGLVLIGEIDEGTKLAVQLIFAYSAIWGIGGNIERWALPSRSAYVNKRANVEFTVLLIST